MNVIAAAPLPIADLLRLREAIPCGIGVTSALD
jgi:hypothetical protein